MRERAGLREDVVVHRPGEVVAALEGRLEHGVEAAGAAEIAGLVDRDQIGLAVQPLPRAVGAEIVDHDDLVDRAVLGADRLDAALERLQPVEGGDGGGDGHACDPQDARGAQI